MWLSYYFNLKRNCDVSKPKSPRILLNKSIKFNINKVKFKTENATRTFKRETLCFSLYWIRQLKVKLCRVGARDRKKRSCFVTFFLSKGNIYNICVLSQCIIYWINIQNIYTLKYQKTVLNELFCLFLK